MHDSDQADKSGRQTVYDNQMKNVFYFLLDMYIQTSLFVLVRIFFPDLFVPSFI